MKLSKTNERVLKALKEKKQPIKVIIRFISRNSTSQKRVEPNSQTTERNYQPGIIYPAELFCKYEGEMKTFPDIQKLREFITRKTLLQEILKRVILKTKKQKVTKLQERSPTNLQHKPR